MFQDILTWVIVGGCVLVAVAMIVRRFRGVNKNACNCGCGSNPEDEKKSIPSKDICSGCALADLCKKPEKK